MKTSTSNIVLIVAIIVALYFFVINKRNNEAKQLPATNPIAPVYYSSSPTSPIIPTPVNYKRVIVKKKVINPTLNSME